MSPEELKKLKKDDKIRHKITGHVFTVNKTHPEVVATRAIAVVSPMDWELIAPTDQDAKGQRFSMEGQTIYDAEAKKKLVSEDLETAKKVLTMLQNGSLVATQLDWE